MDRLLVVHSLPSGIRREEELSAANFWSADVRAIEHAPSANPTAAAIVSARTLLLDIRKRPQYIKPFSPRTARVVRVTTASCGLTGHVVWRTQFVGVQRTDAISSRVLLAVFSRPNPN
jgi:hypothetical protein